MQRPNVESVEGISPAVAIQQKNPTKTSRSTVGTATEIHDYLRLLWARVGRTYCPDCGRLIRPDTVTGAVDRVAALPIGSRVQITFPLHLSMEVSDELIEENLKALGFIRVLADGEEIYLGDSSGTEKAPAPFSKARELLVIVDRLKVGGASRSRLADSLGTAFVEGEGEAIVLVSDSAGGWERLAFTERFRCANCGSTFPEPVPTLFSFNSPLGACPTCNGFGATLEFDLALIVPDPVRTLADGAVDPASRGTSCRSGSARSCSGVSLASKACFSNWSV
jgi:excinuclease ABC subunit A